MSLFLDPLSRFRRQRQIDAFVDDFVIRCRGELVDGVRERALVMSPDEARGYVRAHARELVASRIEKARERRLVADGLIGPIVVERIVTALTEACDRELTKVRVAREPWRRAA